MVGFARFGVTEVQRARIVVACGLFCAGRGLLSIAVKTPSALFGADIFSEWIVIGAEGDFFSHADRTGADGPFTKTALAIMIPRTRLATTVWHLSKPTITLFTGTRETT